MEIKTAAQRQKGTLETSLETAPEADVVMAAGAGAGAGIGQDEDGIK